MLNPIKAIISKFRINRSERLARKAWLAVAENPDRNVSRLKMFQYKSQLLAEAQQQGRAITFSLPIYRI